MFDIYLHTNGVKQVSKFFLNFSKRIADPTITLFGHNKTGNRKKRLIFRSNTCCVEAVALMYKSYYPWKRRAIEVSFYAWCNACLQLPTIILYQYVMTSSRYARQIKCNLPRRTFFGAGHVELGHLDGGAREYLPHGHPVRPHVALRREQPRVARGLGRVPGQIVQLVPAITWFFLTDLST